MYSQEIADEICARLMIGQSMRQIAEDPEMPDRATMLRWMARYDEFAAKCACARVISADAMEDDMADIEDRTLSGDVDPAAARVVLSSKQWRASKLAPKKYGDKIETIHSGELSINKIQREIVKPKDEQ